ncbi:MAG: endolytic transglycosylase MltG [Lachnospiraceae bacterium]|nr:endolytic transglycosylase MltG [Lachnospiraceae bacterium]
MAKQSQQTQAALDILGHFLGALLNLVFYVVVAFGIYFVATNVYEFSYQVFGDRVCEAEPGRDVEIHIAEGESTMDIAEKLYMNKVVINQYTFYLKVQLFEYKIMQGTFLLNTSMTYDEILEVITDLTKAIPEET